MMPCGGSGGAGTHERDLPGITILDQLPIDTRFGRFRQLRFTASGESIVHLALIRADVRGHDVPTRVHSECLTGDVFGSRRCDCGEQLRTAMEFICEAGRGVVVYLRGHEGRGIGLVNKLKAYALQEQGLDTIEANVALGLPVDARSYRPAAAILRHLGVRSIALVTNNPTKVERLTRAGVACSRTVPMPSTVHRDNERYLRTKAERMGHSGLLGQVLVGFGTAKPTHEVDIGGAQARATFRACE
jgi:GTP cyclohydrolase II